MKHAVTQPCRQAYHAHSAAPVCRLEGYKLPWELEPDYFAAKLSPAATSLVQVRSCRQFVTVPVLDVWMDGLVLPCLAACVLHGAFPLAACSSMLCQQASCWHTCLICAEAASWPSFLCISCSTTC